MASEKITPDQRRAQIIETAKKLFAENGINGTKVSDIVKEIGVAQGTFYWYFKSKEDVVDAIAGELAEDFLCDIINAVNMPGLDALNKLIRVLEIIIKRYEPQ